LQNINQLANDLWEAADQLRANPNQHDAIEAIYKRLKKREDDPADIIGILRHLQGVVDESVTMLVEPRPGAESGNIYDISKINFDRLRQEFRRAKQPNMAV